ncbi:MAG TPA: hypothetical protein VFD90_12000 [Gaiellales bacterium]|jgi:hypothetical protein|nr:hypothetical protein [Gaiellales bacterium]
MSLQPGCLTRFWLWACVGVAAMFGTFSTAGGLVWPLLGAGIGLLAARRVTRRRATLALVAGFAGLAGAAALSSPWPLAAGLLGALALALVRTWREAALLAGALVVALIALLALRAEDDILAVALAPALLILAALAAGRQQREAAGAITGAGLALFAVGAPLPGISLTLAGGILMLALGLRRRRLAAAVSA